MTKKVLSQTLVSGNFTDRPFQLKIKKKNADNYFDNHIYFFTDQYFWADERSET